LHEDTEKNIITATLELPGIKKEDVQLIIQNNILTVSVENKISSEYEESGYIVRERHIGKLSRSLVLPLGVKVSYTPRFWISGVRLTGGCW
jgi:HSP20 family protein